jgi:MFS family permease
MGTAAMVLVMTAAPPAMVAHQHSAGSAANVIQWHMFFMFAPSLGAGELVARWGAVRVLVAGVAISALAAGVGATGVSASLFTASLSMSGLGWSLMFVGATAVLEAEARSDPDRGGVHALNELLVALSAALASLAAGYVSSHAGWTSLNLLALVPLAITVFMLVVRASGRCS